MISETGGPKPHAGLRIWGLLEKSLRGSLTSMVGNQSQTAPRVITGGALELTPGAPSEASEFHF